MIIRSAQSGLLLFWNVCHETLTWKAAGWSRRRRRKTSTHNRTSAISTSRSRFSVPTTAGRTFRIPSGSRITTVGYFSSSITWIVVVLNCRLAKKLRKFYRSSQTVTSSRRRKKLISFKMMKTKILYAMLITTMSKSAPITNLACEWFLGFRNILFACLRVGKSKRAIINQ